MFCAASLRGVPARKGIRAVGMHSVAAMRHYNLGQRKNGQWVERGGVKEKRDRARFKLKIGPGRKLARLASKNK